MHRAVKGEGRVHRDGWDPIAPSFIAGLPGQSSVLTRLSPIVYNHTRPQEMKGRYC